MTGTTAASGLSSADREFLRAPRLGFLTTTSRRADEYPAPRPVWYELADDDTVQLFSLASSPKVRRVQADPRASLVVATGVGEAEHWVSVTGRVTIEPDGAPELATRLAERYWDLSDPSKAAALDDMLATELVRIVIHPERVVHFTG